MARATGTDASPVIESKTRPKPRKLTGPYGASFDGKGAKGLTFERRWTRPGVHPYDEIDLGVRGPRTSPARPARPSSSRRTSRSPSFWSQLATNVVVSKYFRGHVGTPEREHSVKQLIDRVVNTIAAWARDPALLRHGRGPRAPSRPS